MTAPPCVRPHRRRTPLPILGPDGLRRRTIGRWRAGVLIGVHVLIAIHVAHWLHAGRTLTPLEPSEAMEFVRTGLVNAGLIFFALAILSTLVLGRWFCGWGCHVVALQDLSGWLLRKAGVRPRPLRSRTLMLVPLLALLYMFVAPVLLRTFAGAPPALHGLHLTTDDFWGTFPGWTGATLTFVVCGFACVYLLGQKGFCTNGCPYGGIFGVVDRLAPLRIRVTDDCNQCGHCTAVCTSNVRVGQEVRDYRMVVDPGCMKCLDCVHVCPNDALYVGWGAPAWGLSKKDRSETGPTGRRDRSETGPTGARNRSETGPTGGRDRSENGTTGRRDTSEAGREGPARGSWIAWPARAAFSFACLLVFTAYDRSFAWTGDDVLASAILALAAMLVVAGAGRGARPGGVPAAPGVAREAARPPAIRTATGLAAGAPSRTGPTAGAPSRTGPTAGAPSRTGLVAGEELLVGLLFLVAMLVFRGLYGLVAFLAALGMSAVVAYLGLYAVRMLRERTVQLQTVRLKLDGGVTRAGGVYLAAMLALAAFSLHSAVVQHHVHRVGRAWGRLAGTIAVADPAARNAFEQPGPPTPASRAPDARLLQQALEDARWIERWSLMPGSAATLAHARLHLLAGDVGEYERRLERLCRRGAGGPETVLELARYLEASGRMDDAERRYQEYAARRPLRPAGYAHVALVQAGRGAFDAARATLDAALDRLPGSGLLLLHRGLVEAESGEIAAAEPWLRRAVDADTASPHARVALGRALLALGKRTEAREQLEACVRLGYGTEEVRALLAAAGG